MGATDRDAKRVESTKREVEGNNDVHMKELEDNLDSTIDAGKKRKKRKGGLSFSNSKQRRGRELKKKEETYIEGRGTHQTCKSQEERAREDFRNNN